MEARAGDRRRLRHRGARQARGSALISAFSVTAHTCKQAASSGYSCECMRQATSQFRMREEPWESVHPPPSINPSRHLSASALFLPLIVSFARPISTYPEARDLRTSYVPPSKHLSWLQARTLGRTSCSPASTRTYLPLMPHTGQDNPAASLVHALPRPLPTHARDLLLRTVSHGCVAENHSRERRSGAGRRGSRCCASRCLTA
jgi:hypothetical protein